MSFFEIDFPIQTELEARQAQYYETTVFSRNSAIYGVSVCVLIVFKLIKSHFYCTFVIIFSTSVFFGVNNFVIAKNTRRILKTGRYFRDLPRKKFLLSSLALVLLNITCCYIQMFIDNTQFYLMYSQSIIKSVMFFSLAAAVRSFGLAFRHPNEKLIRRGLLGIIQRILIFCRDIYLFSIWIPFLSDEGKHKYHVVLYVIGKIGGIIYLVYDTPNGSFIEVVKLFIINKNLLLIDAPSSKEKKNCKICDEPMDEPVILPCNHICCYKCAFGWISNHRSCLFCREPVSTPYYIDLSDGKLPFAVILFPF